MDSKIFETGKTYFFTFATDSSSRVEIVIERRTAKSVWIKHPHRDGKIVRRAISVYRGEEQIFPLGTAWRRSWAPAER